MASDRPPPAGDPGDLVVIPVVVPVAGRASRDSSVVVAESSGALTGVLSDPFAVVAPLFFAFPSAAALPGAFPSAVALAGVFPSVAALPGALPVVDALPGAVVFADFSVAPADLSVVDGAASRPRVGASIP
ncbi:hypothetical protein CEY15_07980 [Dietzia natronolimnaea]|uniref:Uncharacterized protein n=1 Tax=Dietzia natronolimnaea TaxID=161920 RepID=A0A2A2WQJ8_9ACTN|nr:hypothetical protein CEY15_07980 [Dietzia natronolimnaea]